MMREDWEGQDRALKGYRDNFLVRGVMGEPGERGQKVQQLSISYRGLADVPDITW